ncbi:hypothetical protein GQ53DRAFT_16742 [Thozetella sp. PMI_491]|nr:hypothetical protein GQ53DRAFT_16742 [Thozetella sp. PMI_491]
MPGLGRRNKAAFERKESSSCLCHVSARPDSHVSQHGRQRTKSLGPGEPHGSWETIASIFRKALCVWSRLFGWPVRTLILIYSGAVRRNSHICCTKGPCCQFMRLVVIPEQSSAPFPESNCIGRRKPSLGRLNCSESLGVIPAPLFAWDTRKKIRVPKE